MKKIIIGSRGSELALWQAHFVQRELKKIGLETDLKIIKTQGDAVQNLSFDKLEGKGFFTKEIEDALLNKDVDLAVHSHKDLPTTNVPGLSVAAVSYREDPSELLLIRKEKVNDKMKFSLQQNAVVGTSSARRKAQLLAFRNDIELKDLRGNVPTRINKLRENQYDAIMLAAAGVERLEIDLSEFHVEKLDPKEFIPAPAQGVLALQIRENDHELNELLQKLNHSKVAKTIGLERKILNLFDGGCQLPLGVFCESVTNDDDSETYKIWASKAASWNSFPKLIYVEASQYEGLAEKVVAKINQKEKGNVFITKDIKQTDFFTRALAANGFQAQGKALIEIKKIEIKKLPSCDWICFASKNAVRYFFEQVQDIGNAKLAAIGKSTADEIRKYNKRADFIGYSTDTKLTGKQFAAQIGRSTVLFPQAKESMRTMQKQITGKDQCIDLNVYETIKKGEALLGKFDRVVFTSPSNVDAFFEHNRMEPNQKVIAMGDATAASLLRHGVKRCAQPPSFNDFGLAMAVLSV